MARNFKAETKSRKLNNDKVTIRIFSKKSLK